MIKKITILILTFITIQVNGQNILLSEDFNSGSIPSNFTTYDLDGQTLDPILYTWMTPQASFVNVNYMGAIFAGSASLFTSAGTADKWMVTPAISLSNNSDTKTLQFDAAKGDLGTTDGIEIYVSTGSSPADFLSTAALYNSTGIGHSFLGEGWDGIDVDITPYSGQTIYIAFRNNNTNQMVIGIDNIEVIEQSVANNINEEISENLFNIYPNPTKDAFSIQGEYLSFKLYDSLGKLTLSSTKKEKINISFLNNGIYSLKIQTKDFVITKKLIISE